MIRHFVNRFNSSLSGTAVLATALLLGGCGGGSGGAESSGASTSPRAESTLSGSAIKGVIRQGLVLAYLVEDQSGAMVKADSPLGAPVRTDANGNYQITVSAELSNATIIVELESDAQTRMVCDVTEGCGNDDSGNPIGFGDEFRPSDNFILRGLVTGVNEGDLVDAHLSPLTHMVVARAEGSVAGLTRANIAAAQTYVEDMFELESGVVNEAPLDITSASGISVASEAQLEASIVSAAFLGLVNSPDWDSIDEVMAHISERLSAGGDLTLVNLGAVRDVALDDVFYEANEIASELLTLHTGSTFSDRIANVVSQTEEAYDDVVLESEQIDPVQILSQPAPLTVDEGEAVLFSVSAQGGGSLSFQWRLDGVSLAGENGSTLRISSSELSDGGVYDVVVSNSVGSVTSLSALLQVNAQTSGNASVALSWDIPTQREDGSELALYEINGYTIKYGTTSGNLTESVNVVGAGETEALIEDLQAGTYYFSIATVDSDGLEGDFSSEITQTVM